MPKIFDNIQFEKLHGASNDFIFLDFIQYSNLIKKINTQNKAPISYPQFFLKEFVINLCHRTRGVGADGIVFYKFVDPQIRSNKTNNQKLKVEILIVNSDGSFAATCGNALRCLGLMLMRSRVWDGLKELQIDRLSPKEFSIKKNDISNDEQFVCEINPFATLIFGQYVKDTEKELAVINVAMGIEKKVFLTPLVENSLIHFGKEVDFLTPVFVQLSNPHWVFISPLFKSFTKKQFEEFGLLAQIELKNKILGNSVPLANIGMLSVLDISQNSKEKIISKNENNWSLAVFERGAGFTECCGSGATAARVALEYSQLIPKEIEEVYFKMPGGKVSISNRIIQNQTQRVLSGDAQFVFQGSVSFTAFSK
ncbi:hypothetical protein [Fluviispira multicolorata]|uniref:diaminopimelate epimerase n=1 Tax=Fluviispira multicolorata TaxID=2654512 RepID=A0A833JFD1_9BACT|nr:hypothetical protein [Fluviispira multicolorata]KAB8033333.1 hypothetical protein GCL57_01140 [Fluviispira multicolorata]